MNTKSLVMDKGTVRFRSVCVHVCVYSHVYLMFIYQRDDQILTQVLCVSVGCVCVCARVRVCVCVCHIVIIRQVRQVRVDEEEDFHARSFIRGETWWVLPNISASTHTQTHTHTHTHTTHTHTRPVSLLD